MPPEVKLPLSLVFAFGAAILGNFLFWPWLAIRWRRGRSPIAYEARRPVPWNGFDLAIVVAIGMLLMEAGRRGINVWNNGDDPAAANSFLLALTMTVELATLIVAAGLMMFTAKATADDLGLRPVRIGSDIARGVLTYAAVVVPIMLTQLGLESIRPYKHQVIEIYQKNPTTAMLVLMAVAAGLVAPLCEEFFFRVLLQGWFEAIESKRQAARARPTTDLASADFPAPGGGSYWPILASSLLFALAHWGQGLAPIPLFFFALVLGYLYRQTHRLWPSFVVHALLNSATVLILWQSTPAMPA